MLRQRVFFQQCMANKVNGLGMLRHGLPGNFLKAQHVLRAGVIHCSGAVIKLYLKPRIVFDANQSPHLIVDGGTGGVEHDGVDGCDPARNAPAPDFRAGQVVRFLPGTQ